MVRASGGDVDAAGDYLGRSAMVIGAALDFYGEPGDFYGEPGDDVDADVVAARLGEDDERARLDGQQGVTG